MTKAAIAIATAAAVMAVAALAVSIGVSRNLDQQLREQDRRLDALTGNVEVFAALESLDLRLANLKAETIQQTRTTSYAQLGHHRRIRDLEARLDAMGIPEATPGSAERLGGISESPPATAIPSGLTAGCEVTLIGGDPRIVVETLEDPVRTAHDSSNGGGCRFSEPVARVILTLEAGDSSYTETFLLDPPSMVVQFPLVGIESAAFVTLTHRDGDSSYAETFRLGSSAAADRAGGPLPPGEYTRRLVAFTEDGASWELTGNAGFLPTVTVATSTPSP